MLELYWLQICPYYDPSVVIYDRKLFIRLATGLEHCYELEVYVRTNIAALDETPHNL